MVWDCHTGQGTDIPLHGVSEVGCLLSEGPWLFVGVPNVVKAWNTLTSTEQSLDGPTGQVHALTVVNQMQMIFAGTEDGTIFAWKFNSPANAFEPVVSLAGHTLRVVSLVSGAGKLYSASMDNTIRGVLALCGMNDEQSKPVLLCSCNDNSVRLYDLPSFKERCRLFSRNEVRVFQIGSGGLFFTGDGEGELKVWKWDTRTL